LEWPAKRCGPSNLVREETEREVGAVDTGISSPLSVVPDVPLSELSPASVE
jgi:hypothetical protein